MPDPPVPYEPPTVRQIELPICIECGDDHVCEGYDYCSECLERLFP